MKRGNKIKSTVNDLDNWLVKYNSEINWNKRAIQFTRCLKEYKIQYQNILFKSKTRRIMLTEIKAEMRLY